jgi:hypothetical protein
MIYDSALKKVLLLEVLDQFISLFATVHSDY